MIIAFTVGNTSSYDRSLAEDLEHCFKLGKRDDYDGGWIWKNAEEAEAFIQSPEFLKINWGDDIPRPPEKFSVYKVELVNGWNDVSPIPGEDGIYNLLIDSRFYK